MNKGQSKKLSWLESILNTFIGFVISTIANYLILPIFGYNVNIRDSFLIGVCFTIISLGRGYLVRRLFNYFHINNKK